MLQTAPVHHGPWSNLNLLLKVQSQYYYTFRFSHGHIHVHLHYPRCSPYKRTRMGRVNHLKFLRFHHFSLHSGSLQALEKGQPKRNNKKTRLWSYIIFLLTLSATSACSYARCTKQCITEMMHKQYPCAVQFSIVPECWTSAQLSLMMLKFKGAF